MKEPLNQRISDFMAGKGFYIVLFLCVAAIGISGYYLYTMPETLSVTVSGLPKGSYHAEITAKGFWRNASDNALKAEFVVK